MAYIDLQYGGGKDYNPNSLIVEEQDLLNLSADWFYLPNTTNRSFTKTGRSIVETITAREVAPELLANFFVYLKQGQKVTVKATATSSNMGVNYNLYCTRHKRTNEYGNYITKLLSRTSSGTAVWTVPSTDFWSFMISGYTNATGTLTITDWYIT